MKRRSNIWSFYLILLTLLLFMNLIMSKWKVSPPAHILWGFALASFLLGIIGFADTSSRMSRVRSWMTVILSLPLSFVLFLGVIRFLFISEELVKTTVSPDHHYKIHFYLTNGGATTSFGVLGKMDGPLWFEKLIYDDYPMDHADVEWVDDHTILINGHVLDLKEGETYSD
ncbi:DUF5412 domain-containing protein [Rossellomorea aquimaris]|uniref:DUF5412 family protein n=1 Tax=Rossellomorea aquimaris TaxID=189382 RepID=UPI001CD779EC|nr:DUF5412 family protein [Rossellomorea aquimaris]MCA1054093.1 DUF5412 domain-containing protein [Rossellomorea aquimaris]